MDEIEVGDGVYAVDYDLGEEFERTLGVPGGVVTEITETHVTVESSGNLWRIARSLFEDWHNLGSVEKICCGGCAEGVECDDLTEAAIPDDELEDLIGFEISTRKDTPATGRINLLVRGEVPDVETLLKQAKLKLKKQGLEVFKVTTGRVKGVRGTKIILKVEKKAGRRGRPAKVVVDPKDLPNRLATPAFGRTRVPSVRAADRQEEIRATSIKRAMRGTKAKFDIHQVNPFSVSITFEPVRIPAKNELAAEDKAEELAEPILERLANIDLNGRLVDIDVSAIKPGQFSVVMTFVASTLFRKSLDVGGGGGAAPGLGGVKIGNLGSASFDWLRVDGILVEISKLLRPGAQDHIGKIDKRVRDKAQKRVTAKHLRKRTYRRREKRRPQRLNPGRKNVRVLK